MFRWFTLLCAVESPSSSSIPAHFSFFHPHTTLFPLQTSVCCSPNHRTNMNINKHMRTRRLANIYANIRRRRENKHKQTSPIINKNANKHEQHEQRRDTWHFVSKLPFLAIFRINGSLNPVEISLRMTFAWQSAFFWRKYPSLASGILCLSCSFVVSLFTTS